MNEFYVYEWYVVNTGEVFYVGKGKGNRYKAKGHKNDKFWEIYNSEICDVRFVKKNISESDAFELEIKLISFYRTNTNYRLANIADGGQGCSGYSVTEEMKEHLRIVIKSVWENSEFKERMIKLRKDPNGPYQSSEFKNKISALVSGKNNQNSVSVVCLETGEFFPCIKLAREKYNIKTNGSMSVALKYPQKTAGGKHWIKSDGQISDEDRFKILLNSLARCENKKPIICCNTRDVYYTKSELYKAINKSIPEKIFNRCLNSGVLVVNDMKYMYISDFLQSHQAEMSVENPE